MIAEESLLMRCDRKCAILSVMTVLVVNYFHLNEVAWQVCLSVCLFVCRSCLSSLAFESLELQISSLLYSCIFGISKIRSNIKMFGSKSKSQGQNGQTSITDL